MDTSPRDDTSQLDDTDRQLLTTFGRFMDLCLQQARESEESSSRPKLLNVLQEHLGVDPSDLPVVQLDVMGAEFVNLDVAVTALVERHGDGELVGVGGGDQRHHQTFGDMVQQPWGPGFRLGALDRVRVETGPDSSREAATFGVYLFRYDGQPVAVLQRRHMPRSGDRCGIEVLAPAGVSAALLEETRQLMLELNVFRGKVLSFAAIGGEYEPETGGLSFLARPHVTADDVILPAGSLERAQRHVVGTAQHRAQLVAAGQLLKRGLLLYGPPGTGKTHTVRHLISTLEGVTVFILTGSALRYVGEMARMAQVLQSQRRRAGGRGSDR